MLFAALLLLAAGLLLRGFSPTVLLFPGTIVAGAAIALMNVLLPSLVKRRTPERAGLLIGLYLLMLAAGAIVASVLAVPVFNAASGLAAGGHATEGSAAVRIALALWAGPALVAALIWLPQLRYRTLPEGGLRRGPGRAGRRARPGPEPPGLAGHLVHGAPEPVLLRHPVLVPDDVPGSRRERGPRRGAAGPDEPGQRGDRTGAANAGPASTRSAAAGSGFDGGNGGRAGRSSMRSGRASRRVSLCC